VSDDDNTHESEFFLSFYSLWVSVAFFSGFAEVGLTLRSQSCMLLCINILLALLSTYTSPCSHVPPQHAHAPPLVKFYLGIFYVPGKNMYSDQVHLLSDSSFVLVMLG